MSESDQPETSAEGAEQPPQGAADDQLPEEWKPEPREWTWKDLFTAPMLAFKPKCMVIAVITVLLMSGFSWVWVDQLLGKAGAGGVVVLGPVLDWVGLAILAAIFGLGATLISVFMKADLLDDEFLSCKEALGQFKGRVVAAIMVPLFLVGVLAGFKLLIYLGELLCSIPFVGSALYAIFYPIAFLLALFTVLLAIGVLLSIFVGPAVVSIRKHGWFDNVIDTFEAVGTKPHVLVGNLILTGLMVLVCYGIGHSAIGTLTAQSMSPNLPGTEVPKVDLRSNHIAARVMPWYDPVMGQGLHRSSPVPIRTPGLQPGGGPEGVYYRWITGLVAGGWKVLITALIAGYAVNIFLAGGMLTYLAVREDDYWDDEDLEDLDQLAKELEEEAKREEAAAATEDGGADADKTDADTKVADAKTEEAKAEDAGDAKAEEAKDAGEKKPDSDEKDQKDEDKKDG